MPAFQFHTWQDLKSQQLARSETSKPSKAKLLKDKESENISGNVHFLKNILYLMDCIHFMVYHHFFFRRMRRAGRSTVRWMSSGSTCRSTSWKTSWSGRSRSARPSTTNSSKRSTTWFRTIDNSRHLILPTILPSPIEIHLYYSSAPSVTDPEASTAPFPC